MKISRREAISPVIATIIIIAVTIAISLAVAAWLMGLWTGFVGGPKITASLVKISYKSDTKTISAVVNFINTGTAADKISQNTAVTLRIGGKTYTCASINPADATINPTPPDNPAQLTFTFTVSDIDPVGYTATIEIRLMSGNTIVLTGSVISE
jgi:FlaG/FlaF family flagellin (archaellin)